MKALLLLMAFAGQSTEADAPVDYVRDVKPILQHKCYACHGALKQQSGLRLDTAKLMRTGGDSGPVIVPGKPDDSLILQAVTGTAGFRMPPKGEGTPLTDEEIGHLRKWIAGNAPAPKDEEPQQNPRDYWSYRRPRRPDVPEVTGNWGRTPIDALRRVHIDLIGLPPTREQLHAFLKDGSPKAFEKVVDGLLARPEYGQRWGRHWMDIWRYSDWYGSRGINEIRYSQRHIWRWRDWIVDSLNDDKGYDRMVMEMLAGDELAPDDPTVLPATGYLGRNWYKFDRNVWMFETIERSGEAFLGLTFRCCRCHDHKYDPISQEEYYRYRAFFEPHNVRTDPVSALIGTEKDATLGQVLKDGIARVYDKESNAKTYRFERGDNRYPDKSKELSPGVPASLGGEPIRIAPIELPVGGFYPAMRSSMKKSLLAQADTAIKETREKVEKARAAEKDALQKLESKRAAVEKNPDAESAKVEPFLSDSFDKPRDDVWQIVDGDWKYENGMLIEKAVTSFATIVTKENHPPDFKVHLVYRPLEPGSYRSIGFSFDYQDKGNSQDVYTSNGAVQAFHRVGGKQTYPQIGIVRLERPFGKLHTLDVRVRGSKLEIDHNGKRTHNYTMPVPRRAGKFSLWVHSGSAEFHELQILPLEDSLETLQQRHRDAGHNIALAEADVRIAEAERSSIEARIAADEATYSTVPPEQSKPLALKATQAEKAVEVAKADREIANIEHQIAGHERAARAGSPKKEKPPAKSKVPTDLEAQLKKAQEKRKLLLSATEKPDGKYQPVGKQFPNTSTGRRLALARWIASPSNPRTARVAVNHIWGRHFGTPLVATPQNFGLNGARPTHTDLLDWLASELVASDWRMKPLHRLIVLSSVYRQASSTAGQEANLERDPNNRFLWRMSPRRMEAEVVRDSVLHLAGALDLSRGGPEIPESDGEKVLRRSLYFRNTPNEKMAMLEIFDVADPNSCYRRKESVVPGQALALMNSGLAQDHARTVAAQLAKQKDSEAPVSDDELIAAGFEHVLTRVPRPDELARCRKFLELQRTFLAKPSGQSFASGGSSRKAPSADVAQRARENLIHVLFLHNDFVTVR